VSNGKPIDLRLALVAVVAFVAIIAAYVVLVALGHQDAATGLAPLVLTLLGFVGLGGHVTQRLGQQDQQLTQQTEQLAQITHQTNGVLTERIRAGADSALRQVLRETGYNVPDGDPVPAPPEVPAP
jgi:ABC-type transport system involved in cytochrome bd biosynthesis fused ATPase/permease subunit